MWPFSTISESWLPQLSTSDRLFCDSWEVQRSSNHNSPVRITVALSCSERHPAHLCISDKRSVFASFLWSGSWDAQFSQPGECATPRVSPTSSSAGSSRCLQTVFRYQNSRCSKSTLFGLALINFAALISIFFLWSHQRVQVHSLCQFCRDSPHAYSLRHLSVACRWTCPARVRWSSLRPDCTAKLAYDESSSIRPFVWLR